MLSMSFHYLPVGLCLSLFDFDMRHMLFGSHLQLNAWAEIRNAAMVIFVANTRFQGVSGLGYGTLIPSDPKSPLSTSSVRKEFHRIKL